jgi:hypothetical protein
VELRSRIRTAAWILGGAALSIAMCLLLTVLFTWLLPNSLNKEIAIGYGLLAVVMAFSTSCFGAGVLVGKYAGSGAAMYAAFTAGTAFAIWVMEVIVGWDGTGPLIVVLVALAFFGAFLGFVGGALGAWWSRRSRRPV